MSSSVFFGIAGLITAAAAALYVLYLIAGKNRAGVFGWWLSVFGAAALAQSFFLRWSEARIAFGGGFFMPEAGGYDAVMMTSFFFMLFSIFAVKKYGDFRSGALLCVFAWCCAALVPFFGISGALAPLRPALSGFLPMAVFVSSSFFAAVCGACVVFSLSRGACGRFSFENVVFSAVSAALIYIAVVLSVNFFYSMAHAGASEKYLPLFYVIMSFSAGGWIVALIPFLLLFAVMVYVKRDGAFSSVIYEKAAVFSGVFVYIFGVCVCGGIWLYSASGTCLPYGAESLAVLAQCGAFAAYSFFAGRSGVSAGAKLLTSVFCFLTAAAAYPVVNFLIPGSFPFGGV